jgi:hypothetical protein
MLYLRSNKHVHISSLKLLSVRFPTLFSVACSFATKRTEQYNEKLFVFRRRVMETQLSDVRKNLLRYFKQTGKTGRGPEGGGGELVLKAYVNF